MIDTSKHQWFIEQADSITDKNIREMVQSVICSGEINASDSVILEKSILEEEWEKMFLDSIGGALAYGSYPVEVLTWFEKRGIIW